MNPGTLRALEFDRIVASVAELAVTPTGRAQLLQLHPQTEPARVAALQRATSEGTRVLSDHAGFPLRAPQDLLVILDGLAVEGRALEPVSLFALSDYLESIEATRQIVRRLTGTFPILNGLVEAVASFKSEIADVRRKIEPSGEVADHASPALAGIRDRLRRQRSKLRTTLDGLLRGRDTAKYLQEQVVTDRNGRYVLMVRAEHRSAIPGLVHGSSSTGATLFLEPLETVEINNDIIALLEEEAEEVRRILLALTDAFRDRGSDLGRTIDVATELDVIQARARYSIRVDGVEPVMATDGTFELRNARHPLLISGLGTRDSGFGRDSESADGTQSNPEPRAPSPEPRASRVVPVSIMLTPPVRILVIAGPNTGGKTVALKTAGLLALMAQAGLHIPVDPGSKIPIFQSVFADIGDEQSISASLSTFSAHITNVVSMDRDLALPALVLLDEVGAGTDPVEGGALGTAVIDHFRARGAHLIATTHYDALKSYASTTPEVVGAAFGFNPETFAPTYQLQYGTPGRSLALEIAGRLGMPPAVIRAARENLTDREQQLADHLARVDRNLHALEDERRQLMHERAAVAEAERRLRAREESVREREATARRRLEARLDDQLRDARRDIDAIMDGLKQKAAELRQGRRSEPLSTGEAGAMRADARAAIDRVVANLRHATGAPDTGAREKREDTPGPVPGTIAAGVRVAVGALGLEGVVTDIHGAQAEIDVRGKRLRASLADLRVLGGSPASHVKVNVELQPREGLLSELNIIGTTVDEAMGRLERFLDESTLTDQKTLRIIHGHGTGQLRKAVARFLKEHPLVAHFNAAPMDQGGGGVTIVELKE
ncbi:MAG TPA: Smr/MutS family protein [Vicinamibacterales bacterium]|nr:Smr/MutS family protein [Vicinamibacterales bacterium]